MDFRSDDLMLGIDDQQLHGGANEMSRVAHLRGSELLVYVFLALIYDELQTATVIPKHLICMRRYLNRLSDRSFNLMKNYRLCILA